MHGVFAPEPQADWSEHIIPGPFPDSTLEHDGDNAERLRAARPKPSTTSLRTLRSINRAQRHVPVREVSQIDFSAPPQKNEWAEEEEDEVVPQALADVEDKSVGVAVADEWERRAERGKAERERELEAAAEEVQEQEEDAGVIGLPPIDSEFGFLLSLWFQLTEATEERVRAPATKATLGRRTKSFFSSLRGKDDTDQAKTKGKSKVPPKVKTAFPDATQSDLPQPDPQPEQLSGKDGRTLRCIKKSLTNLPDAYHGIIDGHDAQEKDKVAKDKVVAEGWESDQLTDLVPHPSVRRSPTKFPSTTVPDGADSGQRRPSFARHRTRSSPFTSTSTTESFGIGGTSASTRTSAASAVSGTSFLSSFSSERKSSHSHKSRSSIKSKAEIEPLYTASTVTERTAIGPTMLNTPAHWALSGTEHGRMYRFPPLADDLADAEVDAYTRHGLPLPNPTEEGKGEGESRVRKVSKSLRKVASKVSLRVRHGSGSGSGSRSRGGSVSSRSQVVPEAEPEVDFFDYFGNAATYAPTKARSSRHGGGERHACYEDCVSNLRESAHRLDKCVCQCKVCAPGNERRRPVSIKSGKEAEEVDK